VILRGGAMVTGAFPGDLKKPRPAVIMQADEFIEGHRTVLACPFSTFLADAPLFRPTFDPNEETGLEHRSQAMVDKITPLRKDAIGRIIGAMSVEDMQRIEIALIIITGLRGTVLPVADR
jgi:mRNA interferase MazF